MKAPDWSRCTEKELWEYVAFHLKKSNIDTILVGGAVVSVYSDSAYRSGDINLVTFASVRTITPILSDLGLKKAGRHFEHPKCPHLFVEFVSPPAAIGNDYNIKPKQIKIGNTVIKLYSPTDSIRDRLASYMYFDAKECMDQAVLVAKTQPFSYKKIKQWCIDEGYPDVYKEFLNRLKSNPSQPS